MSDRSVVPLSRFMASLLLLSLLLSLLLMASSTNFRRDEDDDEEDVDGDDLLEDFLELLEVLPPSLLFKSTIYLICIIIYCG